MKKIVPLLLALAVCVWAADVWLSKPFTDWSDKDIQKIETNSPWAKQVPLSLGEGGGSGSGKRGKGGGNASELDGGPGGGSMAGGGGRNGGAGDVSGGSIPSMILTVTWQTALPIRQATAKKKFGAEVATSTDAKKLIEEDQKFYAILLSGLPGRTLRGDDRMKEMLIKNTSLLVKGKDPIQASDVQTGGNDQRAVVLFLFPKSAPISLDDKDVEFSTKLGPIQVKQKFHLKDMLFNGKLDL